MTASSSAALAAQEHVRTLTARSGTSFFWAMRLLPPPRRNAMYAVYAFCREVDDIADEGGAPVERRAGLDAWRAEIDRIYDGAPETVTGRALVEPTRTYDLLREDFLAVIDGMEMDAAMDAKPGPAPPSLAELLLYCDRVAGAVGKLSVRVFGDASERARDLAEAEGRALQLTNILRDLAEDADRGRLYLPRELLARHGVPATDAGAALRHPGAGRVAEEVAALARENFERASRILAELDRRTMRPAAVMLAVYRRYLAALEERGWDRPAEPVRVSKASKLWIALRHGLV